MLHQIDLSSCVSAPLGGARVTDGHAAQPRSQSDVDALKESLFSDLRTAKRNGYEDSQILQALLNRKGRLTAPPPSPPAGPASPFLVQFPEVIASGHLFVFFK